MANFNKLSLNSGVPVSYTLKDSRIKSFTVDVDNNQILVNWSKETAAGVEKSDGFTQLDPADLSAGIISGLSQLNDLLLAIVATKEGFPPYTIGP